MGHNLVSVTLYGPSPARDMSTGGKSWGSFHLDGGMFQWPQRPGPLFPGSPWMACPYSGHRFPALPPASEGKTVSQARCADGHLNWGVSSAPWHRLMHRTRVAGAAFPGDLYSLLWEGKVITVGNQLWKGPQKMDRTSLFPSKPAARETPRAASQSVCCWDQTDGLNCQVQRIYGLKKKN